MKQRNPKRVRRTPVSRRRHAARATEPALWRHQVQKLRAMLCAILPGNSFYTAKFRSRSNISRPLTRDDFASLPFTTKDELVADQAAHSPYGSNMTYPIERYCRMHQSSGTAGQPLRWLDTPESWDWFLGCWRLIYDTIGLRRDDRLFFPFSFGPFIGFWGAFEGAARLGNMCISGGGMTSTARLQAMIEHRATIVACTPTYALRLAEVADDEGIDLAGSQVRALVVAGEPGGNIPATRARIEAEWGARVFDHTGMTEMGAVSVECESNPGGVHVIEPEFIAEVIDPKSRVAVLAGTEGELVLTNLGRWGSPLVRYRTGDIVRADPRPCPCGRPWLRLVGGILGRVDDMVVIRGNNLYPAAVESLLRKMSDVVEYRCTVSSRGPLNSIKIEVEPASPESRPNELAKRVARAFQDQFHFRADVIAVSRDSLPRFEMKARRFVRE